MRLISAKRWKELEELLNRVANEREEDRDGPGSAPTPNSRCAKDMLGDLKMERRKPAHIR